MIASFANALIYRIPRQIAIYKGRSYCENCYHKLSWYD
ncbi:MAG TPA: prepilin peptidase, partial [[Clostridium] spiroforme]|nr:prepilin peptidase [Thomasclavelia spiroformis]